MHQLEFPIAAPQVSGSARTGRQTPPPARTPPAAAASIPRTAAGKPYTPLAAARAAGEVGMTQALEHAESDCPSWGDVALQWVERYAREHALFTPEDCAAAAYAWGLSKPADGRSWGQIYRRAVKAGIIERSTVTYQRVHGHGCVGVMWASKS